MGVGLVMRWCGGRWKVNVGCWRFGAWWGGRVGGLNCPGRDTSSPTSNLALQYKISASRPFQAYNYFMSATLGRRLQ